MPKKIAALLFLCLCFLPLQASGDDDLAKLGKARLDAAEKAYKIGLLVDRRETTYLIVYDLSVRWLHAELDLATKREERIAGYAAHLQRMKDYKKSYEPVKDSPFVPIIDSLQIEAEYWLAKERAGK